MKSCHRGIMPLIWVKFAMSALSYIVSQNIVQQIALVTLRYVLPNATPHIRILHDVKYLAIINYLARKAIKKFVGYDKEACWLIWRRIGFEICKGGKV